MEIHWFYLMVNTAGQLDLIWFGQHCLEFSLLKMLRYYCPLSLWVVLPTLSVPGCIIQLLLLVVFLG